MVLFFIANWKQSAANRKEREQMTSKAKARATPTETAIQWINTIDVETRAHCILEVFSMSVFFLSEYSYFESHYIFIHWTRTAGTPLKTQHFMIVSMGWIKRHRKDLFGTDCFFLLIPTGENVKKSKEQKKKEAAIDTQFILSKVY